MNSGKVLVIAAAMLLAALGRHEANAQPAPVTLHLDSMPPADAVAEFTKQTGVEVQFWPQNLFEQNYGPNGPPSSISVSIDNQPLWVALDAPAGLGRHRPGAHPGPALQFRPGRRVGAVRVGRARHARALAR